MPSCGFCDSFFSGGLVCFFLYFGCFLALPCVVGNLHTHRCLPKLAGGGALAVHPRRVRLNVVDALQHINVEGLDVMKLLMERRKVELEEEKAAAEAKQNADRKVRCAAV